MKTRLLLSIAGLCSAALISSCNGALTATSTAPFLTTSPTSGNTTTSHIPATTLATADPSTLRYDTRWTFGDISVLPAEVKPGENIHVKVYLYMPDVIETWGDVNLSVDGTLIETQHVFCYGDEVILTQLDFSIAAPGRHEVIIGVEMQDHPPGLKSSDDVKTYVTVTN